MRERTRRLYLALSATLGVPLVIALAPAQASAGCGLHLFEHSPGRHAIWCLPGDFPDGIWVVPLITTPTVTLYGADGDESGGRGGFLQAKLPVTAGEELEITVGEKGAATTVSRNGEPLLVAEGGAGPSAANYVSPEAELLGSRDPHPPLLAEPRDGWIEFEFYDRRPYFDLTDPLQDVVVDDYDDVASTSFGYEDDVQVWNVPDGMNRVAFELFGGSGASSEPRAHVLAGFAVKPGEQFGIRTGGPGEDTLLLRGAGWWWAALAVGGDTERDIYIDSSAAPEEVFWEGGGTGSEPGVGHATVHYWHEEPEEENPDQDGGTGIDPAPGAALIGPTPAPVCIVPKLRGKSVQAARKTLIQANCALGKVHRKRTDPPRRGRIVRQFPSAGAMVPASQAVNVVVGSPR